MKINGRIAVGIAIVVGVAVAGYWFWNSPERQIQKVLSKVEAAFEEKNLKEFMKHVSLEYRDDLGLAYLNVRQLMKQGFEGFDGFEVEVGDYKISVNEGQASIQAKLKVISIIQGEKAYLLGDDNGGLSIEIEMIKAILRWKILAVNGITIPFLEI